MSKHDPKTMLTWCVKFLEKEFCNTFEIVSIYDMHRFCCHLVCTLVKDFDQLLRKDRMKFPNAHNPSNSAWSSNIQIKKLKFHPPNPWSKKKKKIKIKTNSKRPISPVYWIYTSSNDISNKKLKGIKEKYQMNKNTHDCRSSLTLNTVRSHWFLAPCQGCTRKSTACLAILAYEPYI